MRRLISAFAVACGLVLPVRLDARAPAPVTIRIGVVNTDVSSEPVYADAAGFFQRAGLRAAITTYANGKQVLDALAAGTLDVGFANVVSAVDAIQKGAPLTVIAPSTIYDRAHPITILVQAPASTYRSGRDLNGKTLSVPAPNDLGEVSTRAWIDATGGDSRTVHYVTGIPSSQIADALATHRVDAAELSEPALTTEVTRGNVKPLAPTFDVVGHPFYIGVFLATKAWAGANSDAARRFSAAMRETARWANGHRSETAAILAQRLGVTTATTGSMVRASYGDALSPALIQPIVDVAAKYGVLKPMRAADLLGG